MPAIAAADVDAVGRYLAVFALCNDCHTAGWLPNGDVPEEMWMAGNPVGYEGPWGITFPSNLRLRVQNLGPIGEHMPAPIPPGAPRSEPYTTLRVWPAGTEDLPWEKDLLSGGGGQ